MMQRDLFPTETHDPGGKSRSKLPAGVRGDAVFVGDRQEYRPLLRRWTGETLPDRFAMFIGMNPSTAGADVSDPTVVREWGFTVREGFTGYVKCNIADYRATHPEDLLKPGVVTSSPANLPTILEWAARASLIIVCHGKVNRALVDDCRRVSAALRAAGLPLKCFGRNADLSPRHPLYLPASTGLLDYA